MIFERKSRIIFELHVVHVLVITWIAVYIVSLLNTNVFDRWHLSDVQHAIIFWVTSLAAIVIAAVMDGRKMNPTELHNVGLAIIMVTFGADIADFWIFVMRWGFSRPGANELNFYWYGPQILIFAIIALATLLSKKESTS